MENLNKAEMGKRIKEVRKKVGLRQWQLAELLGTTQSAVHKYEHGVIPEPRRLVKLARLGNTTIEWILTGQHWESGSVQQDRLPPDVYRLAERLHALGPDQSRILDDALKILSEAAAAMSPQNGNDRKLMDLADFAAQLSLVPEKQKGILNAALRIHRAVLDSVLDLEMDRLSATEPSPQNPSSDRESRPR